jgi:hypothetical protein
MTLAQNLKISETFTSFMSGGDKMNVVIFILLMLLAGLYAYLFSISRRIKKHEK